MKVPCCRFCSEIFLACTTATGDSSVLARLSGIVVEKGEDQNYIVIDDGSGIIMVTLGENNVPAITVGSLCDVTVENCRIEASSIGSKLVNLKKLSDPNMESLRMIETLKMKTETKTTEDDFSSDMLSSSKVRVVGGK